MDMNMDMYAGTDVHMHCRCRPKHTFTFTPEITSDAIWSMKVLLLAMIAIDPAVGLSVGSSVGGSRLRQSTRRMFIQGAGLGLSAGLARPAFAELYTPADQCTSIGMCSSNAKTMLASYDAMLLQRTNEEL